MFFHVYMNRTQRVCKGKKSHCNKGVGHGGIQRANSYVKGLVNYLNREFNIAFICEELSPS